MRKNKIEMSKFIEAVGQAAYQANDKLMTAHAEAVIETAPYGELTINPLYIKSMKITFIASVANPDKLPEEEILLDFSKNTNLFEGEFLITPKGDV